MDLRLVFYMTGMALCFLAASMTLPVFADLHFHNTDWKVFLFCIVATAFFGGLLLLSSAGADFKRVSLRDCFLFLTGGLVLLSFFAALPFYLSQVNMDFEDAFFEAVASLTTTGVSMLEEPEKAPPGILLWRALLQWGGGFAAIIAATSLFPWLRLGGLQIFHASLKERDKSILHNSGLTMQMAILYTILTLTCAVFYKFSGMRIFDSVTYAMTTLSAGGFSNTQNSFMKFDMPALEITAMIFMLISALPFLLVLKCCRSDISNLIHSSQIRVFMSLAVTATIILYASFLVIGFAPLQALRYAAFNAVSSLTGTGYANINATAAGAFVPVFLLLLAITGSCAGSAGSGLKIFRLQILYTILSGQVKKILHPHAIFVPRYNNTTIREDVLASVAGFFFAFIAVFLLAFLMLAASGIDVSLAFSAVASCLSNAGPPPGLTPAVLDSFPQEMKIILCLCMLAGRLEILGLLVVFSPDFWKN